MLVLSSAPGRAVLMKGVYTEILDPPPSALTFSEAISASANGLVVQGMGLSHDVDVQVQNMIGPDVYLYTFADGLGLFELDVACPLDICRTPNGAKQSGLAGILAFYRSQRLSRRQSPMVVTLAPESSSPFSLPCYLKGVRVRVQNPEFNLATAQLVFLHAGFVEGAQTNTGGVAASAPF